MCCENSIRNASESFPPSGLFIVFNVLMLSFFDRWKLSALPISAPLLWFLFVGGIGTTLLLTFFPDYSLRYAYAWLSFYLGCSGCSAFVFFQSGLRNQFRQYLKTYPCELISALIGMVAVSVLVNGFIPQATAVLTMLLCLGTYPVLCFLWSKQDALQRKYIVCAVISSILFVLCVEAMLITLYAIYSLPMSSSSSLARIPRVFLNVRDGNQWLALGAWVPLGIWWNQCMYQMNGSRKRNPFYRLVRQLLQKSMLF